MERTSIRVKCRIIYLVYPKLTAKITYHACYCSFFYMFRDRTPYFLFLPLVFVGLLAIFMNIEIQQKINALTDSFVFNELQ